MKHPVRPDEYIEINNLHRPSTKGREVIRMQHTLLGETRSQGDGSYFARRRQAVTRDDSCRRCRMALGTAAIDLSHFKRWYSQAGTPTLAVRGAHDAATSSYTLM
jgi:aminopeptidase N